MGLQTCRADHPQQLSERSA